MARSKIALICAGGGIGGYAFELGTLKALDDLFVNQSINHFDIYAGVSAGGFVLSSLVNNYAIDELIKSGLGASDELETLTESNIVKFNWTDIFRILFSTPGKFRNVFRYYWHHRDQLSLTEMVLALGEIIPSGFFDLSVLEQYIRRQLEKPGKTNDFRKLKSKLLIPAINIDTGELEVFGKGKLRTVPISQAVAGSCAAVPIFKPFEINGSHYIDGGFKRNLPVELAIKEGAKLIICINPLVPIINEIGKGKNNGSERSLGEKGFQAVINQIIRMLVHSKMVQRLEHLQEEYPDVDILLFEPSPRDHIIFSCNFLGWGDGFKVLERGFDNVMDTIEANYHYYRTVLKRHGIELSQRLLGKDKHPEILDTEAQPELNITKPTKRHRTIDYIAA